MAYTYNTYNITKSRKQKRYIKQYTTVVSLLFKINNNYHVLNY